jgi:putative DNA primase/helicase
MYVDNIKKSQEYIMLSEFLADNDVEAEIETILDIYKGQYRKDMDPIAFWGIECDNSPELRKIKVKAEILRCIALIGDVVKAGKQKIKEGIHVQDLFFMDIKGREHIEWTILREFVQEKLIFKTIRDTDELLVYKNGIYVDARNTIRDFIHSIEGIADSASIRIVREVTSHIKARTGIEREEFNVDPNYLPLKNGVFNFETHKLEEFDPEKLYTYQLPVKYDQEATYEATDRFMREVGAEGDLEVLQEVFGYCLYARFPSHHFFWLYGGGRNGKGVYTALLTKMIGPQNVANVAIIELDGHHRFAASRLMGKLLNVISEANTEQRIATEVLKSMTGSDAIGGEKKGVQDHDDFINFAKFLIHSNDFPLIDDTSDAFWDRAIPIPFANKFSGDTDKKEHWKDIIAEDSLSGILNYALEGLFRLRDNNWEFTGSNTQEELKANMRRMAQPTKTFQVQWTVVNNRKAISVEKLYAAMQEYCDEYGIVPPSERDFVRDISSVNGVVKRTDQSSGFRKRVFMGITLKKEIQVRMTIKALAEATDEESSKNSSVVDVIEAP